MEVTIFIVTEDNFSTIEYKQEGIDREQYYFMDLEDERIKEKRINKK